MATYDNVKKWMNRSGYVMEKSLSGDYYYCMHYSRDHPHPVGEVIWMDPASEDAKNLETATWKAYNVIMGR